ncbi:glycosyltransferase family 4 protein [Candidatus Micrarchaeota archaeon]|nr:glycosyltransferase family 4 protein [Candidatus Micrarchaeota archaeon]
MKTDAPAVLFLGSKEFPFGSNKGQDPIKSGGIETYAETLAKALSKKARITLVTREFRGSPVKEVVGGVRVERVPWIPGFFLRNPSFNLFSFAKALELEYDLVHAHGLVAGFFGLVAGRLRGKKVVVTPHGIASGQYSAALNAALLGFEKLVYGSADATVFLSEGEKKRFAEKRVFAKNAVVIPSGIQLEAFDRKTHSAKAARLKKELGINGETVVTFVGRLSKVKGVDYLLQAFKKSGKNSVLLIAGDGPERSRLEALAKKLGLNNVFFLGHRTDTPAILAASDVFVLPSLSEGVPVSLLEAMASGCAPIVTDIGLPVEKGVDSLVVKPRDAESLAEALKQLCGSVKLRSRISQNALKNSRKFSSEKMAEAHARLYESLLS